MTDKINCQLVQEQMSAYVDGQLLDDEFDRHIESCEECQRVKEDFLLLGSFFDDLDEVEVPVEFSLNLHEALQEVKPKKSFGSQRFVIWAAAAAIVLMMMIEITVLPSSGAKVADMKIESTFKEPVAVRDEEPADMMESKALMEDQEVLVRGVEILVEREDNVVATIEKYGYIEDSVGRIPVDQFEAFSRELGAELLTDSNYDIMYLKQDLERRLEAVSHDVIMWQDRGGVESFIYLEILEAEGIFLEEQIRSLDDMLDYVFVVVKYK